MLYGSSDKLSFMGDVVEGWNAVADHNGLRTVGAQVTYKPVIIGPGLSQGLNLVLTVACPGLDGAQFGSPFMQLDAIDQFDPDFKPSYQRLEGSAPDDTGILGWGLSKHVAKILEAAGKDLTREGFVATGQSGQQFASNVYPPGQYGPGAPFGAPQMHMLQADCASRTWKTIATFKDSFQ